MQSVRKTLAALMVGARHLFYGISMLDRGWFYFWVSLLDQLYWVAGAALGALSGSQITFDTRELIGVLGALLCLLLFGPDRFMIPAMGVILAALTILRPWLLKREKMADIHYKEEKCQNE